MFRLKQTVKMRKLDGFSLELCEVPPPSAIVVSSDTLIRSLEAVMAHFQKEANGGGRLKRGRADETEDGCLLLEFEDPKGFVEIAFFL